MFYAAMGVSHVKVPIRSIVSDGADFVVIERFDATCLTGGRLLAAVPVVGVVHIRDGKDRRVVGLLRRLGGQAGIHRECGVRGSSTCRSLWR